MSEKVKNVLALSIIPQVIIVKLLGLVPDFIEKYYSNGIYPFISKGLRYLLGWVPFSIGDILYTLAGLLILRFLVLKIKYVFKKPWYFFREVLIVVSFTYFAFHFLWGLNYYRPPLYQSLELEQSYTTEELVNYTEKLIEKTNALQLRLMGNDTLMVKIPYSRKEIYRMSVSGYREAAKTIPGFSYSVKSVKNSLYSLPLTYMGYSGYLNPFTNEAQVNDLQVDYRYPMITSHEIAHQIGYSAENEANFIGFLAATKHKDLYFQYSANAYMLRYCLNEVYNSAPESFVCLKAMLHKGVYKNYAEVTRFWKKYENKIEPLFKNTFNIYLKANNQQDGIKTYSYVVALLVNYDKS